MMMMHDFELSFLPGEMHGTAGIALETRPKQFEGHLGRRRLFAPRKKAQRQHGVQYL